MRIAFVFALAGCGGGTFADITGSVAGDKFTAAAYYWGGPYVAFIDQPWDCMEMSWVQRGTTFNNGAAAPTEEDMRTLLFTFDGSAVAKGDYSVEGDAPVDARMLDVSNSALTVYKAETGNLVIDEVEDEGHAAGSLDVGFEDGELKGEFEVEFCNNMKSKD